MVAVILAWVFFRAETLDGALIMLHSMFGLSQGLSFTPWQDIIPDADWVLYALLAMTAIVILLPNSIEFTRNYQPVLNTAKELGRPVLRFLWSPRPAWGLGLAALFLVSIIQTYRLNDLTEFIYFNF